MKKITTLIVAFVIAFSFTSCTEDSLQGYLVKSQDKSGFITFDVPASILQVKSEDVSAETKATLKTLKKINIVALPFNNDNGEVVEAERAQLEKIFKSDNYKSLMRFTEKNIKINLFYTGTGDEIDEDNETVRIFSDRGSVLIPVKYSKNVKRGILRTTFHQPEVFINIITGSVGDKETMTPEYKVVAVDFERV